MNTGVEPPEASRVAGIQPSAFAGGMALPAPPSQMSSSTVQDRAFLLCQPLCLRWWQPQETHTGVAMPLTSTGGSLKRRSLWVPWAPPFPVLCMCLLGMCKLLNPSLHFVTAHQSYVIPSLSFLGKKAFLTPVQTLYLTHTYSIVFFLHIKKIGNTSTLTPAL